MSCKLRVCRQLLDDLSSQRTTLCPSSVPQRVCLHKHVYDKLKKKNTMQKAKRNKINIYLFCMLLKELQETPQTPPDCVFNKVSDLQFN